LPTNNSLINFLNIFMPQNVQHLISSKICSHCGGEVDGWKCSKCGLAPDHFDSMHAKECAAGGKLQLKCKACGQAEDNCTCEAKAETI